MTAERVGRWVGVGWGGLKVGLLGGWEVWWICPGGSEVWVRWGWAGLTKLLLLGLGWVGLG